MGGGLFLRHFQRLCCVMEHFGVAADIAWLRQRADRRRRLAQTLTSSEDARVALEEARLAEAEALRLEAELLREPPLLIT
jgi:hypothetical protein